MRDAEVIRTLNLPNYLAKRVTFEVLESYVGRRTAASDDLFFAVHLRDDGSFIGTSGVSKINGYAGTADIGFLLGRRELWGRGLATDALDALCGWLFGTLGLRRLTAGAMATNPAMIRVFEKLGFRIEGVMRRHDRLDDNFIDHIHLGCLRDEFRCPPDVGQHSLWET